MGYKIIVHTTASMIIVHGSFISGRNYLLNVIVPRRVAEDIGRIEVCVTVRALGSVRPLPYIRLFTRNFRECFKYIAKDKKLNVKSQHCSCTCEGEKTLEIVIRI